MTGNGSTKRNFESYKFGDYLWATAIAPLFVIPTVFVVCLFWTSLMGPRYDGNLVNLFDFDDLQDAIAFAIILNIYGVPTAYIATALFSAPIFFVANGLKRRISRREGGIYGLIGGACGGVAWLALYQIGNVGNEDLRILASFILPIAIISGLVVGVKFVQLVDNKKKWLNLTD